MMKVQYLSMQNAESEKQEQNQMFIYERGLKLMGLKANYLVDFWALIISLVLGLWFSEKRQVKPEKISSIIIITPSLLLCSLHLFANYTITDYLKWVYKNSTFYLFLSLLLSISGTIGGYIDGAIALHKYKKRNRIKHLSHDQAIKIIKFGSYNKVIKGRGVCDLRWKSTLYNLISNSTGAICHVAMLVFIKTLPGYVLFLEQTEWIDYFNLLSPIMVFPSLSQFGKLQKREYPNSVESEMDNPDNFYLNRIHVFLDSISLWFTLTMVLIFGFSFFSYTITNIRKHELSWLFILPLFATVVFLFYLATSPLAITHKAVSVNEYKIGRLIIAVIVVTTLLLYKPSWSYLVIIAFCIIIHFIWKHMIWRISNNTRKEQTWESTTMWITIIPIIMIMIVVIAVILQSLY